MTAIRNYNQAYSFYRPDACF